MKRILILLLIVWSINVSAQELQLHYDFRHSLDPELNASNFPTLYFQYFKTLDSGSMFLKPGSFLLQVQSDFKGKDNNKGNFYIQASHSFRFWKPKIFIHAEYSGGLGIAEPGSYGYYITNAFSLGVSHLFAWKGGYYNFALDYRYNAFEMPSHDIMFSIYWWKGIWNYRVEISGDIEVWTLNRNHGDPGTSGLEGKAISLFGEPQVWLNLNRKFSAGSKIYLYYHVLTNENVLRIYPTIGLRYKI